FFQAEDGIRDFHVTGVQTCALPICGPCDPGRRIHPPSPAYGSAASVAPGRSPANNADAPAGSTTPAPTVAGRTVAGGPAPAPPRSEERRVGKGRRCRRWGQHSATG